ncbi:hypothetical protein [Streptomyces sp. NPDC012888]|uniref:hypothetical protein n=1 Tax=Streptomyces sp. NPDC012888 TaxID=3364855 RepID=UPI0036CD91FE
MTNVRRKLSARLGEAIHALTGRPPARSRGGHRPSSALSRRLARWAGGGPGHGARPARGRGTAVARLAGRPKRAGRDHTTGLLGLAAAAVSRRRAHH